mmetsp:Transcript_10607/g.19129  ORF Transcript_10607/g.19129 Transcript_10607/m.19129 type:complete len:85 (-) Transcript_10607:1642-1896(-)
MMSSLMRRYIGSGTVRGFHTSRTLTGGHKPGEPDYIHAKNMYQLKFKPMNKVKAFIIIFGGIVGLGSAVPVFAVWYQHEKLKGN